MRLPAFVGFAGIDENTNLGKAIELAEKFPVAWGILISETNNTSRYPSMEFCEEVIKNLPYTMVHFCGSISREINKTGIVPEKLIPKSGAIQLNLRDEEYALKNLEDVCEYTGLPVIRQSRDTDRFPELPESIHALFDPSGGRGISIDNYPISTKYHAVGYAGGFKPGNCHDFVQKCASVYYWIDMESGVRTNDWLDLDKCQAVCDEIYPTHKK